MSIHYQIVKKIKSHFFISQKNIVVPLLIGLKVILNLNSHMALKIEVPSPLSIGLNKVQRTLGYKNMSYFYY